jgi:hypothetical protein
MKSIILLIICFAFLVSGCKKCQTCVNVCYQVYTYDTLVRKYDTICTKDFSSNNVFLDTLGRRNGYLEIISISNKFSSCDGDSKGANCR